MLDHDKDGFINFREFVRSLGLMSKVEASQRLTLLYILHLPPILPSVDLRNNSVSGENFEDFLHTECRVSTVYGVVKLKICAFFVLL